MSEPTPSSGKQTWVSAVIETTPDLAEQERLVRLYDYEELVNALLIESRTLAAQRTALLYCYEKLQPMQPFEDWVKEIGK